MLLWRVGQVGLGCKRAIKGGENNRTFSRGMNTGRNWLMNSISPSSLSARSCRLAAVYCSALSF